ncbi:MAG: hypothetical protein K2W95_07105 [Candidatus Obscuribacterales bacterium]|nr:hypothetical protein [Candidatus Obscuribacterales bacterium]
MFTSELSWVQVDPSRHAFDAKHTYGIAYKHIPETPPGDFLVLNTWQTSITKDLVEIYGDWARGWCWSRHDGGPVSAWCCATHSWTDRHETSMRVDQALREWRLWIEKLDKTFASLSFSANTDISDFEFAVEFLVTEVVEQTDAGDAWYGHCEQVLEWYLDSQGISQERSKTLILSSIGGRFESWCEPNSEVVADIARKIGSSAYRWSR